MNVNMNTKIKLGVKALTIKEYADSNLEPIAAYGNEKFVVVNEAWADNNKFNEPAYFAHAVKLGDVITDNMANLYLVEFAIIRDSEDASQCCDWAVIESYVESDKVEVIA